jgi:hypothetical protein
MADIISATDLPAEPPAAAAGAASAARVQATLIDFALAELVRQHRQSFQPLWSRESWAKLQIWLALNCGCSADEAGLRRFAEATAPLLSTRLRRVFFERELQDLGLHVLADPAEQQVLVLPIAPGSAALGVEQAALALERLGLLERVVADRSCWSSLEQVVAIPWEPDR